MTIYTKEQIASLMGRKDLIGAVAYCLARTALDALARLEDAEAAQALAFERAAEAAETSGASYYRIQTGDGFQESRGGAFAFRSDIAAAIRALAPASGVAALAALRAERALLRADRDSAARMWQASEQEREAAVERSREASQMLAIETNHAAQAEADRDRLAAANAALEAQVGALREAGQRAERALRPFADRCFNDNGDVTVTDTHTLAGADFMNAYQALGKMRAALASAAGGAK